MKFKVIRLFSKRSENLKVYNVGDEIELSNEDSADLIKHGFIQAVKTNKKAKETKKGAIEVKKRK